METRIPQDDDSSRPPAPAEWMSIGALARRVGVPVETLRTWERRYGFPEPARLPSGHRRYPAAVVPRLRLVRRAIDSGHRASEVVAADEATLRSLLGDAAEEGDAAAGEVARWVEATERLDAATLEGGLRTALTRHGRTRFVEGLLLPFLRRIGDLWAEEVLEVHHEHLAASRVEAFLTTQWRPLADAARGAPVVCATLPDEHHVLGLHLGAWTLAASGIPVRFLGSDTPTLEIAEAAGTSGARACLVAISDAAAVSETSTELRALAAALPPGVEFLVGGPWRPRRVPGSRWLSSFTELADWTEAPRRGRP